MQSRFLKVHLFCLMAFVAFDGNVNANTVTVKVGGTTTTGGGYGGGTTSALLTFSPNHLTINVGDTVTFTNLGGAPHNVHADDNSFRCANGCDADGGNGAPSAAAWSSSVTFTKAGVVPFHCDQHVNMGMTGSITVNAIAAPTIPIGGYISGNWFITGQGGSGFQFEVIKPVTATDAPQMLAIWFVYTPTASTASDGSGQNWIYSQGTYDPTKNTVTLPAILQTGARFPPNFSSSDIRRISPDSSSLWGTLTFTFTDCNNGTASWHSDVAGYNNQNDTPLPIQRLTQIDGTSCP